MPLKNRVTPFGEIIAVPERGALMGNRGILHDDVGRIVRSYQVRRWIACRTAFRGRHRQLLQPHSWTELFFLLRVTSRCSRRARSWRFSVRAIRSRSMQAPARLWVAPPVASKKRSAMILKQ